MPADPVVSFFATQLLAAIDASARMGKGMAILDSGGIPLCQLAFKDRGSRWNIEKRSRVFQGGLADELVAAGICEKVDDAGTTIVRRKVQP